MKWWLTSLVERLALQVPVLLRLVHIMSQCSHTNGIISCECAGGRGGEGRGGEGRERREGGRVSVSSQSVNPHLRGRSMSLETGQRNVWLGDWPVWLSSLE